MFRVYDELKGEYTKIASTPGEVIVAKGLLCPKLSSEIKMDDTAGMNAVYEKIVAVESCHYVLEVLKRMEPRIQDCLFASELRDRLRTFWARNVEAVGQFAEYMYLTHPTKSMKARSFPLCEPSDSWKQ